MFVRDFNAIVERDESVVAARQFGVDAVGAQNGAHVFRDGEHHMLFFEPLWPIAIGIDAAVARIEHHETARARFFRLRFAVAVTRAERRALFFRQRLVNTGQCERGKACAQQLTSRGEFFKGLKVLMRPDF